MISSIKKAPFFQPLKTDREQAIFWISVIVIMTVKLYEGDQSFFVKHFSEGIENTELLNWFKWLYHHLASLLLYCIVPLAIIKFGFKKSLREYGWQLGDWKFGIKATLIAFVVLPFVVYKTSLNPVHKTFYASEFPVDLATASILNFSLWALTYLPHYIGWEFFFRGYIAFELKNKFSAFMAIMFQSLLTTLMHIGKPEGETWGAAIGGIYFGLLTYRTNSVVWAIIFHFYIGLLNTWFCSL